MPHSIFSNLTIASGGRVVSVGLGLIVIKLLTHYLGPGGYGDYVLLLSYVTVAQLFADLGLYLTITQSVAAQPDQERQTVNTIVSLRLIMLVCVLVLSFFIANLIPSLQHLILSLVVIAIGFIFQSISQLFMGVYQHHRSVWRATIGDLAGRLIQISGLFYLSLTGLTLLRTVIAFTVGAGVSLVMHDLLAPLPSPRLKIEWRKWIPIIKQSWPLAVMLLLNAVYFRVDMIILSLFRSSNDVGLYGVAYRIIESALFFPAMFGGLLLPRFSESLAHHQHGRFSQYLTQGLWLLVAVGGLVVVTIAMRPQDIIMLISTEDFLGAAPLLQILGFALAVMFLGNLFGFALVALKQQRALLWLYAVLAILNTLLNFIAIPIWGAKAAAITTVFTELIAAGTAAIIVWRAAPFVLSVNKMFQALIVILSVVGTYYYLPNTWPFLIQAVFATLIMVLVAIATGLLGPSQMSLIFSSQK